VNTKDLLDQLYLCEAACNRCYNECLKEKDKSSLEICMMLTRDCEDICSITANVMARNSSSTELFLKLCAEICEQCAAECEKHSHLKNSIACAEQCNACVDMYELIAAA